MLGGELLAHRFADIGVDVARADRALIALLVDELEELLAGQVLAALDEAGQVSIGDGKLLHFSGLALETHLDRPALNLGVAIAQRGRAEALVLLGVAFVADAEVAEIEQDRKSTRLNSSH